MTDYDSPWKEALDVYFEPFMEFFLPEAHAAIDWGRGYESLDKELQKIVPEGELGRRHVDKLVKVWLKDGHEQWVLIHIEVQADEDAEFGERMFVYSYRIFDRYNIVMPLLGAHQSIAGGHHKAVGLGMETGCQVIQVFTKNTNQWRGKPITADDAKQFRAALDKSGIACPLAHDSYLINLAAPDDALWMKSIDAMIDEVERASTLEIPWVVAHPGAFTTTSEEEGLRRIVAALDKVLCKTKRQTAGILLETTAGQGSTLGWRFEHLAAILAGVKDGSRLGVCFDTCHVFAAGYKMSTEAEYRATMKEFDKTVGLDRIRAFHLNDSVKGCGSRVDRHAHIGAGQIGREPFGWLLRDRRFRAVPMVLETPKEGQDGENCDIINLQTLHELASQKSKPAK